MTLEPRSEPTTVGRARDLLPDAARRAGQVVDAVPARAWSTPSGADGRTVREVLAHLVAELRAVPRLLAGPDLHGGGATTTGATASGDGDGLGADPGPAWRSAVAGSMAAWALAPLDRPVLLRTGATPAHEYADRLLLELTVHTWDLARGAGADEHLDPACVAHSLGYVRGHARDVRSSGHFAPAVVTSSADPQVQLLCLLGREVEPREG